MTQTSDLNLYYCNLDKHVGLDMFISGLRHKCLRIVQGRHVSGVLEKCLKKFVSAKNNMTQKSDLELSQNERSKLFKSLSHFVHTYQGLITGIYLNRYERVLSHNSKSHHFCSAHMFCEHLYETIETWLPCILALITIKEL